MRLPWLLAVSLVPALGAAAGMATHTYFRDVEIPWRRFAATPRLRRGYCVETGRGDAAAAMWTFGRDRRASQVHRVEAGDVLRPRKRRRVAERLAVQRGDRPAAAVRARRRRLPGLRVPRPSGDGVEWSWLCHVLQEGTPTRHKIDRKRTSLARAGTRAAAITTRARPRTGPLGIRRRCGTSERARTGKTRSGPRTRSSSSPSSLARPYHAPSGSHYAVELLP